MSWKWDFKKQENFRHRAGKKVKAFKGAECVGLFKSLGQCRDRLGISRHLINKSIRNAEEINGFIFEYD